MVINVNLKYHFKDLYMATISEAHTLCLRMQSLDFLFFKKCLYL